MLERLHHFMRPYSLVEAISEKASDQEKLVVTVALIALAFFTIVYIVRSYLSDTPKSTPVKQRAPIGSPKISVGVLQIPVVPIRAPVVSPQNNDELHQQKVNKDVDDPEISADKDATKEVEAGSDHSPQSHDGVPQKEEKPSIPSGKQAVNQMDQDPGKADPTKAVADDDGANIENFKQDGVDDPDSAESCYQAAMVDDLDIPTQQEYLKKALHKDPAHSKANFQLALTLEAGGSTTLSNGASISQRELLEKACSDLDIAGNAYFQIALAEAPTDRIKYLLKAKECDPDLTIGVNLGIYDVFGQDQILDEDQVVKPANDEENGKDVTVKDLLVEIVDSGVLESQDLGNVYHKLAHLVAAGSKITFSNGYEMEQKDLFLEAKRLGWELCEGDEKSAEVSGGLFGWLKHK